MPPVFSHTVDCMPTFVPPHPNLNAASCANSSPNPNISPLINGSSKFIAAPLSRPHNVGGEYKIIGELEDNGGDGDRSSLPEYCSESDGSIMEESASVEPSRVAILKGYKVKSDRYWDLRSYL